mmetsp:Transcript_16562/g.21926  ORF Transcript_16562/g.21926 Transcript_16562/m.21926 type:complete len:764 (+) Transcript_16562:183-2474(+)
MPALKFLGRQWKVGGDEFALPAVLTISLRILWVLALLTILILSLRSIYTNECHRGWILYLYLTASGIVFIASIIVHFMIGFYSTKGTIIDAEPRRPLKRFLSLQLTLWACQLISASFGVFILLQFPSICRSDSLMILVQIAIALLVVSQLCELTVTSCCCLVFRGKRLEDENILSAFDDGHQSLIEMQWNARCQRFCKFATCVTCKIFGRAGDHNDFTQVSRVMANVFNAEGRIDVVPSDVFAGLVLLRHLQRHSDQMKKASHHQTVPDLNDELRPIQASLNSSDVVVPNRRSYSSLACQSSSEFHSRGYRVAGESVLDPSNMQERKILEDLSYFSKYMLCIYTWPLFVYMDPFCGTCKLCTGRCCKIHSRHRRPTIENLGLFDSCTWWSSSVPSGAVRSDNTFFKANETALLKMAGLEECDLAYANFANDVNQTPYCIAIDHSRQLVVLAIRGTLSLEDCIVDALAEPLPLDEAGAKWGFDGSGEYCHSGMMLRAEWIREDIDKTQILHMLLQGKGSSARLRDNPTEPLVQDCTGYGLKVVGHSLGAGCAVMCSLMLLREYPHLQCLAYSPPGGLVSEGLAERCKDFVHSVVLGTEIVPRMSFHSMEKIRHDILSLIGRCKVSKTAVTASILDRDADPKTLLYPEDMTPQMDYHRQLSRYEATREAERGRNPLLNHVLLYPPGHLVHFVKTENIKKGCCQSQQLYTPIWTSKDALQEIQVSSTMMIDHFPDRLMKIITTNVQRILQDDDDIFLAQDSPLNAV